MMTIKVIIEKGGPRGEFAQKIKDKVNNGNGGGGCDVC
jgi:hypothetical protein